MAKSAWIIDITDANFEAELVERSKQVPIVVDFWAPWCGPCRALTPLLEQVVNEQQGKVILAKVNTDENPGLAQQFASEGIPAVYGVRDGGIVNQFMGMLPEAEVRAFVASLLPTATDTEAKDAGSLESSDPAAAVKAYRTVLAEDAKHEKARVGLARTLLQTKGAEQEATTLLAGIEIGEFAEEAERLRTVIELRTDLPTSTTTGDDAEAKYNLGAAMASRGEYLPALEILLAAAEDDKALAKTKVRELMVKLFRVLGNQSEASETYRRKLQSLLY